MNFNKFNNNIDSITNIAGDVKEIVLNFVCFIKDWFQVIVSFVIGVFNRFTK